MSPASFGEILRQAQRISEMVGQTGAMQFCQNISRISVSSAAAVVSKAAKLKAEGVDVVDFGASEPDFPTPENIKRAAYEGSRRLRDFFASM